MKKVLLVFLSIILLLQLCSCNNTSTANTAKNLACVNCGMTNSSNSSFCNNCGSPLSGYSSDSYSEFDGPFPSSISTPQSQQTGTAECYECATKGYNSCQGHPCLACNGYGYHECYNNCSNGYTPYGPCYFCDGGVVDCGCENGVIYFDGAGTSSTFPTNINGTDCSYCEEGYVTCPLCEGTGRYDTYEVGGFDGGATTEVAKLCSRCSGRKKVTCSVCYGNGYVY